MDVGLLLGELAGGVDLRGALCADPGVRQVFDAGLGVTPRAAALWACERCPVRERCRQWVLDLPPDERPTGVVGGLVVDPRTRAVRPGCEPLPSAG